MPSWGGWFKSRQTLWNYSFGSGSNMQTAGLTAHVVCLSAARVLLAYGDKNQRQGPTGDGDGGCWSEKRWSVNLQVGTGRKLALRMFTSSCKESFFVCFFKLLLHKRFHQMSAGPQAGFVTCTNRKWQQSCLPCRRQSRGRAAIRDNSSSLICSQEKTS